MTQLLIYENAVPVSQARHGEMSVDAVPGYAFARHTNSVPLVAAEFPFAEPEYAIVFAGNDEAVMPAAILGMRGNENRYIAQDGRWEAKYVPAFVRRYPFVFSSSDDGQRFTLCIDESYPGLNRDGRGQRLFDEAGKASGYTDNVLKFLQDYQTQFQRTRIFCGKLKELDLLEPMRAQITTGQGERFSLGGFMAVNRDRLKKVAADKLAELARTDELELVYLHLQSMRNFNAMRQRLAAAEPVDQPA